MVQTWCHAASNFFFQKWRKDCQDVDQGTKRGVLRNLYIDGGSAWRMVVMMWRREYR
jgi:hypothetical protein